MKKPQASPSALAQKASKSSAKGPATTSPKLMKKPSSNPMHVCAGMTKLSDYKITSTDPEDLHNDFNIVGSRHWKRAFNLAIRLGESKEKAQSFAGKMRLEAKKLFRKESKRCIELHSYVSFISSSSDPWCCGKKMFACTHCLC